MAAKANGWSSATDIKENHLLLKNFEEVFAEVKQAGRLSNEVAARMITVAYWLGREEKTPEFLRNMSSEDINKYYRLGGVSDGDDGVGDTLVPYTQNGEVEYGKLPHVFSADVIGNMRNGRTPLTLPFIAAFCKAFNVPFERMYRGIFNADFIRTSRFDFDWMAEFKEASSDVFISAATLLSYNGGIQKAISKVSENISVRFFMLNLYDDEIVKPYARVRNKIPKTDKYKSAGKLIKEDLIPFIGDKKNTEFRVSDRVTLTAYFAVDILKESDKSFIKVQHYLHEKNSTMEAISYITRPGSPVYDTHKEQIKILWDNGKQPPDNPHT